MAVKECTKCGAVKALAQFSTRRASKDGLSPICKSCAVRKSQEWYARNIDRKKEYDRAYQQRPKAKATQRAYAERTRNEARTRARAWRSENRERARSANKAYYLANIPKHRAHSYAWKRANRDAVRADVAKRRAKKCRATPVWCDVKAIRRIYRTVRPGFHIDHIVPLRSKIVCGLHVPWNLQAIPAAANHRKSNRWWPDMPEPA